MMKPSAFKEELLTCSFDSFLAQTFSKMSNRLLGIHLIKWSVAEPTSLNLIG